MGIKNYANQKKKDRLFEGLQPLFKQGAVHIKRSQTSLISELMDFPKGSHDDTIDAFWLSTQFTRNVKPRVSNINKDSKKRPKRRQYNFMTGARI
jgi:phage terminase large subunit-like protein